MDIYEVWHFKEKSNDLFKECVKDFMKIKLETSPWKRDFETIQDYITSIKNWLDVNLDRKNVAPNPGESAVAKICLNSLWGKFGPLWSSGQRFWLQIQRSRVRFAATIFSE